MNFDKISIVVIGKNEGTNLYRAFDSIKKMNFPRGKIEIIYVDTGSKDNSLHIAYKYTDKVFTELHPWSTPGLARNRGIKEAKYDIIHFLDGDIELDRDYIRKAMNKINEPGIDAVYGYLDERADEGINQILLAHWKNRKEGYHNSTGGGGTYKKKALVEIDGYDERIRKGQETELGERFILAGHKIWFMNEKMGIHDYNVQRFKDLLMIYFLEGINRSHLTLVNGKSNFYKKNRKLAINNFLFSASSISIFILLILFLRWMGIIYFFIAFYGYFFYKYVIIYNVYDFQKSKYFFLKYNLRFVSFTGQIYFLLKCLINSRYKEKVILSKRNFHY